MKVDIVIRGSQATSQQRCVYSCKEKKPRPPQWLSVQEIPGVHVGANANEKQRAAVGTWTVQEQSFTPVTDVCTYSGLLKWCVEDDVRCGTVSALFRQPGTAGWENQAAGEIGVLSGRQVSTCWISGEHFPKDLGWYFRIFWRVLGQIFPSATHRPPPLRLHKSAVDCRKKEMVSPWNQMEMWWDIQSLAEQAQAFPRECDTM